MSYTAVYLTAFKKMLNDSPQDLLKLRDQFQN